MDLPSVDLGTAFRGKVVNCGLIDRQGTKRRPENVRQRDQFSVADGAIVEVEVEAEAGAEKHDRFLLQTTVVVGQRKPKTRFIDSSRKA